MNNTFCDIKNRLAKRRVRRNGGIYRERESKFGEEGRSFLEKKKWVHGETIFGPESDA